MKTFLILFVTIAYLSLCYTVQYRVVPFIERGFTVNFFFFASDLVLWGH